MDADVEVRVGAADQLREADQVDAGAPIEQVLHLLDEVAVVAGEQQVAAQVGTARSVR